MCNPIREIVEGLNIPKEVDGKKLIPLSIGDPTVFGNLKMCKVFKDAVVENVKTEKFNGYCPSTGRPEARAAVADYYQTKTSQLTADAVVICSGGSGALEIAFKGLLSPGDNILLPKPGFALYETMVQQFGSECRYYNCLPEKGWEADLAHMESLVGSRTKAIMLNNPSNPCGSVFSKEHLLDIIAIARRNRLPIITDEIYGNMVFSGTTFHPVASLTQDVPVLAIGGTAKEFLVPGYRIGWILIHDRHGILKHVVEGIKKLSQLIIGSNSLIQSCLPAILTPKAGSAAWEERREWWDGTLSQIENNARFTCDFLSKVPGLSVVTPQGAMYVMVGIDIDAFDDTVTNDTEFTQKLLDEEAVFVIPGKCFGIPNFVRVVLSGPEDKLKDAYSRMANFCKRHAKL